MSLYIGTFAGGTLGYSDGTGSEAQFNTPTGIAFDSLGNLFVCELQNCTIRKITSSGVVTTIAGNPGASPNPRGNTDGTGSSARFDRPTDLAIDSSGNMFICDQQNHRIRKVTSAGVVTTFAGSTEGFVNATGTSAKFSYPFGICIDASNNLYVTEPLGSRIRKVTSAGVVTTFVNAAGGFDLQSPHGIEIDSSGNLYVCDYYGQAIKKVTSAGVITNLAGTGVQGYEDTEAGAAQLNFPIGIALAPSGNLYVTEYMGCQVRKVTTAGVVTTEAGFFGIGGNNDGLGRAARFGGPYGIAVSTAGRVFISDSGGMSIRASVLPTLATVTLSNLSFTYDGTAKIPTTTVSPSGESIDLFYSGTESILSAPVSAGSYVVTASVVEGLYYGSASGVITISKASQSINFSSIPNKFITAGQFSVAPSSSSNLTVSLSSSNTSVATVSGFSITPINAGTTTIIATQSGNINYLAATTVNRTLTVTTSPIAQTIAFAPLSPRRVASIKDIYTAATQLVASNGNIPFGEATNVAQANARTEGSFSLVATASSGLPVTFTSTDTNVATVVGNICTPVTPGVTSILAAQAGGDEYQAATTVARSLIIVEKQFAWLDTRWDLSDLQINASTRSVSSSRGSGSILTIRQGDSHDVAVFFTDPAGASIAMSPTALKLCIREKTNRRPVIIETTSFTPSDFGGLDPYYKISFTANNDSLQRFIAFNGVTDNSDAISAVGEVEWIYDGKVYSSRPFTVSIVPEVERAISDV
jgi:sugar lactone lactonase YvrE